MEQLVNFLSKDIVHFSIRMNIINLFTFIHFKHNYIEYLPNYTHFKYGYLLTWEFRRMNIKVYYHCDGNIEMVTRLGSNVSIENYDDNNKLISDVLKMLRS